MLPNFHGEKERFQITWILLILLLVFTHPGVVGATDGTGPESGLNLFDKPLPGIEPLNRGLQQKFNQQRQKRGPDYTPRTRHLRNDGWALYTNRLFLETSPYLIQHAHNPINWYPWSDEAFAEAGRRNVPVMLSVGYSTCHWCHVMEEESFEDEEIATYLNRHYVAIKVDREERPDIDAIYMNAVMALTGRGGWPMTLWLTPERKPIFGGTYFPARDGDRGGATGFLTLLQKVNEIYQNQPDRVAEAGDAIMRAIQKLSVPEGGDEIPAAAILHKAATYYKERFDEKYGGLKGAPKFPSSLSLRFLLRYQRRTGEDAYLDMVRTTLEKMAAGGLYDQVGGGFHRYSTDASWLVPHFEKMLYDNALLVPAYLEAYQATGQTSFRRIANDVLQYVDREMTSPQGAFYSATDADSLTSGGHREEGYYFTWTPEELNQVLGKERGAMMARYYGVTLQGNFESRGILHTPLTLSESAKLLDLSQDELLGAIETARPLLYNARQKRPAPLRDDKIITAWNGLMISAYAQAGLILDEPRHVERAAAAGRFILEKLYRDGRLYRTYVEDTAKHQGFLNDYAFMIAALLDLYEASHELHWLETALELERTAQTLFEDRRHGGYFATGSEHEKLLVRQKPHSDGAVPSGNSIMILNLLRLSEITFQKAYRDRAVTALKFFSKTLETQPAALSKMLLAVDFYLDSPKEIVIILPDGDKMAGEPLMARLRSLFLPNRALMVASQGSEQESHGRLVPLVREKMALQGKATAYVCEQGICTLPTTDPQEFTEQIQWIKKLDGGAEQATAGIGVTGSIKE
jgi:uncharacterized protein